jgi:hypothetical protein
VTGWFAPKQVLEAVAIRDDIDDTIEILRHFYASDRARKAGAGTSSLDLFDHSGIPYVILLPK